MKTIKRILIKFLCITFSFIIATSNITFSFPLFSHINYLETYGESLTQNSIGSINKEDDGITIGVDETQIQSTTYEETINQEGSQSSNVYVSKQVPLEFLYQK